MSTVCPKPQNYPKEVIGYAEPWIVSPGDEVKVKVSCTEKEYTYRVVRVISGYEGPSSPPAKREEVLGIAHGTSKGRFQLAPIGSYGKVQTSGATVADRGLELSMYIQPWLTPCDHVQTLISDLNVATKTGIAVVLNKQGELEFWVGLGSAVQIVSSGLVPLKKGWLKINMVVSSTTITATLTPQAQGTEPCADELSLKVDLNGSFQLATDRLLFIAASQARDPLDEDQPIHPVNVFNGRIDSVRLSAIGEDPRLLLELEFAREISSDGIIDVSGNERHGVLVNAPSRAMKGYNWDGSETDWTKAKYGYGAIHFHEDDLDDACWDTDFVVKVPTDARSGVYAVEIKSVESGVGDDVVFFVRPNQETTAKVSCVARISYRSMGDTDMSRDYDGLLTRPLDRCESCHGDSDLHLSVIRQRASFRS
jgi:hypothetical protein